MDATAEAIAAVDKIIAEAAPKTAKLEQELAELMKQHKEVSIKIRDVQAQIKALEGGEVAKAREIKLVLEGLSNRRFPLGIKRGI